MTLYDQCLAKVEDWQDALRENYHADLVGLVSEEQIAIGLNNHPQTKLFRALRIAILAQEEGSPLLIEIGKELGIHD